MLHYGNKPDGNVRFETEKNNEKISVIQFVTAGGGGVNEI